MDANIPDLRNTAKTLQPWAIRRQKMGAEVKVGNSWPRRYSQQPCFAFSPHRPDIGPTLRRWRKWGSASSKQVFCVGFAKKKALSIFG